MIHVVWDWNGTLVEDLPVVVESVNAALGAIGEAPITEDDYRAHFTRPVGRFYERLLERSISAAEWDTLDRVFHDRYRDALDRIPLAADAAEAIDDGGGSITLATGVNHCDRGCLADTFLDERLEEGAIAAQPLRLKMKRGSQRIAVSVRDEVSGIQASVSR